MLLQHGLVGWVVYEVCPESIRPFWISREPVASPWCNLTASQRRPYCASMNSHCPGGLVSQQWDTVDWACVLCDHRIHISPSFQMAILALGKAKSRGEPNLGCRRADRPGWCDALPKEACTRAVEWAGALSWWSWSARSVIVKATVTQYTISVNGVSLPTD
jgi:hypothetical protein